MRLLRQSLFYGSAVSLGVGVALLWAYPLLHTSSAPVATVKEAVLLSTTTTQRILAALHTEDAIPPIGKFIAADLVHMKVTLYENGSSTAEYPILMKGRPGSPYETPSGFYRVLTREPDHFNRGEGVHMPYSMEFYGNYFIHGWPYWADGTPVASTYSGGCIRLSTDDAERVYAFAERNTPLFVYDGNASSTPPSLVLNRASLPAVSAQSYLVADLDSGDVYAEREAEVARPIASLTKLMTALVANETIMFDRRITLPAGHILITPSVPPQIVAGNPATTTIESFVIGDLLYPLLMASNNSVADDLATYYGTQGFVGWMNSTAPSLGMSATHFADPSGISPQNISTAEDLYRLAVYLANKKSFIFKITRTPTKVLTSHTQNAFQFANFNVYAGNPEFIGGKVGQTTAAGETMLSLFSVPVGSETRRVAIIVLGSSDYTRDSESLLSWFKSSALASQNPNTACIGCSVPEQYRKIE